MQRGHVQRARWSASDAMVRVGRSANVVCGNTEEKAHLRRAPVALDQKMRHDLRRQDCSGFCWPAISQRLKEVLVVFNNSSRLEVDMLSRFPTGSNTVGGTS